MARILVVEDNRALQILLKETLDKGKHQVITAIDGQEGLTTAQENIFDLIISDLMMPRMDGIELIREIRKENNEVGIIAISGGDTPATVSLLETARLVGADAALSKPFKKQQLLDTVEKVLRTAVVRASS